MRDIGLVGPLYVSVNINLEILIFVLPLNINDVIT